MVTFAKPEWRLSPLDKFASFTIFSIRPLDSLLPPAWPCAHMHFHTRPTFPTACLGLIQLTCHLALQWRCLETSSFQPGSHLSLLPSLQKENHSGTAAWFCFLTLALSSRSSAKNKNCLFESEKNCSINALVKIKLPGVLQDTGTQGRLWSVINLGTEWEVKKLNRALVTIYISFSLPLFPHLSWVEVKNIQPYPANRWYLKILLSSTSKEKKEYFK